MTVFTGSDNGSPAGSPGTNSAAAQGSFAAAASGLGTVTTEDFEDVPTGYNANFNIPGASVALTGQNFGNNFTGISSTTLGNLYGFNTTSGGSKWLGFPVGTATFTFANPTKALGFYITGAQTSFYSSATFTLTQLNGAMQTFNMPINQNGGSSFWGITDTTGFTSVRISNLSNDAWGIDDISFTGLAAVPEPSTWAMMILGFGLIGGAMRSARRQTARVTYA